MIKFEHGMLVLDSSATLEDMRAVAEFQDYVRNKEQERIIKLIENTRSSLGLEYQGIDLQELWELIQPWLIAQIKGENK